MKKKENPFTELTGRAVHPFIRSPTVEVRSDPFHGSRIVVGGRGSVPNKCVIIPKEVCYLHGIRGLRILTFGQVGQPRGVPLIDAILITRIVQ